jgi:hypothetical protein
VPLLWGDLAVALEGRFSGRLQTDAAGCCAALLSASPHVAGRRDSFYGSEGISGRLLEPFAYGSEGISGRLLEPFAYARVLALVAHALPVLSEEAVAQVQGILPSALSWIVERLAAAGLQVGKLPLAEEAAAGTCAQDGAALVGAILRDLSHSAKGSRAQARGEGGNTCGKMAGLGGNAGSSEDVSRRALIALADQCEKAGVDAEGFARAHAVARRLQELAGVAIGAQVRLCEGPRERGRGPGADARGDVRGIATCPSLATAPPAHPTLPALATATPAVVDLIGRSLAGVGCREGEEGEREGCRVLCGMCATGRGCWQRGWEGDLAPARVCVSGGAHGGGRGMCVGGDSTWVYEQVCEDLRKDVCRDMGADGERYMGGQREREMCGAFEGIEVCGEGEVSGAEDTESGAREGEGVVGGEVVERWGRGMQDADAAAQGQKGKRVQAGVLNYRRLGEGRGGGEREIGGGGERERGRHVGGEAVSGISSFDTDTGGFTSLGAGWGAEGEDWGWGWNWGGGFGDGFIQSKGREQGGR